MPHFDVTFVIPNKTMIRGAQTITSIFPVAFETDAKRKGKRSVFASERDACIAYRFYFRYHILRERFDDSVANMEKEFFLSGRTIVDKISELQPLLKDIVGNAPDRKQLRNRYPHFNWN